MRETRRSGTLAMMAQIDLADVRARARAAFVGLAVGDALGATVEFMTPGEIESSIGRHREIVGAGWLHLAPGRVTDDTEMSLCIARAIVDAGGWSIRAVADRLAAWLKSAPIDVGNTCRRGLRRYLLEGSLEGPPNEWDAGNGAVMRMLPVALFTLGDDALLERLAVEQARLTHHNPLSDAACILVGRIVQVAAQGLSLVRMRRDLADAAAREPRLHFDAGPGPASGYVVDTLRAVLHAFFTTRGFEDCLVSTVNCGGDADTTGAIAGMLAGAYYGDAEIPRRWRRKMDPRLLAELSSLAEALVDLSPLASSAV